jgi:hypothetical protein
LDKDGEGIRGMDVQNDWNATEPRSPDERQVAPEVAPSGCMDMSNMRLLGERDEKAKVAADC